MYGVIAKLLKFCRINGEQLNTISTSGISLKNHRLTKSYLADMSKNSKLSN